MDDGATSAEEETRKASLSQHNDDEIDNVAVEVEEQQQHLSLDSSVPIITSTHDNNDKDGHTNSNNNDDDDPIILTKWQKYYAWFMSDVLLYIVILNLANEWVGTITIQNFSISLIVSLVLKILLSIISFIEQYIHHLICDIYHRKVLGAFCMWFIIFISKFVILWIDDIVFSEQVDLGSFWEIVLLSFVLVISSLLSRWFFHQLGKF